MDKNHPEVQYGKTGVLIINLGTPDSTSWWDIRRYLKEFLSDRRVIEVNPIIWQNWCFNYQSRDTGLNWLVGYKKIFERIFIR